MYKNSTKSEKSLKKIAAVFAIAAVFVGCKKVAALFFEVVLRVGLQNNRRFAT